MRELSVDLIYNVRMACGTDLSEEHSSITSTVEDFKEFIEEHVIKYLSNDTDRMKFYAIAIAILSDYYFLSNRIPIRDVQALMDNAMISYEEGHVQGVASEDDLAKLRQEIIKDIIDQLARGVIK